jgi:oligoribonuclease NrnB/cAMP/cGMP phosphodiesterase (DHH superfamily)
MLTKKQINEVRDFLEKSQNPVFLFDNDTDGLCAFLLLQRFSGKGKGVPMKSSEGKECLRKIEEFNSDCVFILDRAVVSESFLEELNKINLPVIWIDHHAIEGEIPEFVNYYNPAFDKTEIRPTTYLCYQVSGKKEDLWLALIGNVSDKFLPEFYEDFKEQFPDLSIETNEAFEVYYKSQIGKIAKIFSFALKDRTTNVMNMIRFLTKAKSPYEVLEENSMNKTMHLRFFEINQKYQKLLEKAKKIKINNNLLFFQYAGDLSISSDLSNELSYFFPDKYVIVAYLSGVKVNISVRGKGVKKLVLKAIENLENATGGGHEDAVGAQTKEEDLTTFRERFENLISLERH